VTVRMLNEIEEMLDQGLAIAAIEMTIKSRYVKALNMQKLKYLVDMKKKGLKNYNDRGLFSQEFPSPSSELIKGFYYGSFLINQDRFKRIMDSMPSPKWIS